MASEREFKVHLEDAHGMRGDAGSPSRGAAADPRGPTHGGGVSDQRKKRRSRKVKEPESDTAEAVNNLTKFLILLVGAALLGWAIIASQQSMNDARDRGKQDAIDFCVKTAIENNISPDYCYEE